MSQVGPEPTLPEIPVPAADDLRGRILHRARLHLFEYGYSALTMDELATELGISKKTLYRHFEGKDAIVRAVIDQFAAEVRTEADALFSDRRLSFPEKLRSFTEGMVERLGRVSPATLRDLQRFAPALHHHVEQMRSRNIPYVFGRLVEEGQLAGFVRADVSPAIAAEFHLHAMQGIMHPDTLRRLRLAPREAFESAIRLLFGGLLTPAGQKQYDKLFPR